MKIRLAEPRDVDAIQQCACDAYEKYIERIGRKPAPMVADFKRQVAEGMVSVLVDNSTVAGFAISYAMDDCWFLENIAICTAYQGGGHGYLLLEQVHKLASDYGVVRLYTNEKMHENLRWYKRQGYIETERRIEDGFARVYMEKRLAL